MLKPVAVVACAAGLAAQTATYPDIVLVRMPAAPVSQLLEVDPATSSVVPLPRFAADTFAPLAVSQDPFDGALYVAVDLTGGLSRIVRLHRVGVTLAQSAVADLPGRVVGLAVVDDEIFVGVDAAAGGVFRLPRRNPQPPVQVIVQPNLTAMTAYGPGQPIGVLAWTGRPGTAQLQSGAAVVDLATGQSWLGPLSFANPGNREVTGIADLLTGVPRHLLSFDDGSFVVVTNMASLSTPFAPVPPGGAVQLRQASTSAVDPTVLGGAVFPHLYHVQAISGLITLLSPPLPGDPVAFSPGLERSAQSLQFGVACGPLQLGTGFAGIPQPGATLQVTLQGPPNAAILLSMGLDDFGRGALPFSLPGGCLLHLLPLANVLFAASASGAQSFALAIPPGPGFLGVVVFSQWFELTTLSTSAAGAHWIGL